MRAALALVASIVLACAEPGNQRETSATGSPSPAGGAASLPTALWHDATDELLPATGDWTNKVELADIDGDGRIDLLFANGGNYSEPGEPELNRAFANRGPGQPFEEVTGRVFGATPDLARVIKARDFDADGNTDILVGATYHTQSRLYMGTGGAFEERTATHLPQMPAQPGGRRARRRRPRRRPRPGAGGLGAGQQHDQ